MTCLYAAIFGILILAIVAAAYTFIWWEILAHEKENLVGQIYHEGEEWVESEEAPCSEAAIRSGKMLAYFVNADGSKVILNQLGTGEEGQELMSHKDDWPKNLNTSRLLRMQSANGERYRYLAAVAPVIDGDKSWIVLMAKKAKPIYYYVAYKCLQCVIAGTFYNLQIFCKIKNN